MVLLCQISIISYYHQIISHTQPGSLGYHFSVESVELWNSLVWILLTFLLMTLIANIGPPTRLNCSFSFHLTPDIQVVLLSYK